MEASHEMSYPAPEIHGKQQMYDLARATFAALREAELRESVELLRTRIFTRSSDQIMDTVHAGEICQWSFKPMVELVLRHASDVALQSGRSAIERQRDIVTTLDLCGF